MSLLHTRLLPFIILTNFLAFVTSQPTCINIGNYTSNSTYKSNLNTLLSSLPTNIDVNGFYNASEGQDPDKVNAMVLCRGDLQLDTCRSCVRNATVDLVNSCPNQKQAIFWGPLCMLRYSNESIFGIMASLPGSILFNVQNASSPDQFMSDLRFLLDKLRGQAAFGSSLRKVSGENRSTVDFQTIFALVQCTPDLTPQDCSSCLMAAAQQLPRCCSGKRGVRILMPSCNIRYEDEPFFNVTRLQEFMVPPTVPMPPPVSSPPPPPPRGKKDSNTARTVIIIVVSVVAFLLLLVCVGFLLRKKIKKKLKKDFEGDDEISTAESLQYDFGKIKDATNNFSEGNKLGQGGFGAVYRGKFSNGQEIAVKRLSMNSGQGDAEFKNEVLLLAKLQHRNLVRLLGFSIEGKEKLLVYEFVENASLNNFIFDPIKRSSLDWEKRYKIITGIARGLLYLHEDSRLRIIHRDLKASNILLDGDINPKIADFGMARLFVPDETQGNTSRIVGTYGYMAPEYALHGQISVKLDVFSFGVLILEIISGQKNNSFRNGDRVGDLLSCAWNFWGQGTSTDMIDHVLRTSSGPLRDIVRCIHIGLLCVQENAADRPTMASVVLMLSSFSLTLAIPSEPAFFCGSSYESETRLLHNKNTKEIEANEPSKSNSEKYSISSTNEESVTDMYPR